MSLQGICCESPQPRSSTTIAIYAGRPQHLFGNSRQLRKELQRIIQHGLVLRSFSDRITRESAMRSRILISFRRA
jgi:hypothetical protein